MNILLILLTLLSLPAWCEEATPIAQTLRVGKDLVYQRGTARAKEQFLEFPYRHAKSGKRQFWAFVVHQPNGSRVIFKKDEVEGKKDESGDLLNQDFPNDHPFQKTLDVIKLDALLNVYKEQTDGSLEPSDWQVLSHGAAVHRKFFKDSEGRHYAVVGLHDPVRESITQPILMTFKRTRQGPVASLLTEEGRIWGDPQPVDPQANLATHAVFGFLESRQGF